MQQNVCDGQKLGVGHFLLRAPCPKVRGHVPLCPPSPPPILRARPNTHSIFCRPGHRRVVSPTATSHHAFLPVIHQTLRHGTVYIYVTACCRQASLLIDDLHTRIFFKVRLASQRLRLANTDHRSLTTYYTTDSMFCNKFIFYSVFDK